MSTKQELDPLRINCPTCGAAPGERCVVMARTRFPGISTRMVPPRPIVGYHSSRKWTAGRGRI